MGGVRIIGLYLNNHIFERIFFNGCKALSTYWLNFEDVDLFVTRKIKV
jgi:hypothetical protein